MSTSEAHDTDIRAANLATRSLELLSAGRQDDAVRSLREALFLAPKNPTVLEAFYNIQKDQTIPPISKLCQKIAIESSSSAAEEALRVLKDPNLSLQTSTAVGCIELLLDHAKSIPSPAGGKVVGDILKAGRGGREHIADVIGKKPESTFETFWALGEDATDGFVVVLLDPAAWKSEESRKKCLRECFRLFLEKLKTPESTVAARSIARLLAARAEDVHTEMNQDGFQRLLSMLDIRSPVDRRSHATLAAAKFIEASEEIAQSMLGKFIASRLVADEDEDLRIAFSAAAAIFPVVPAVASQLFLTEGFVEGLVPSLQGRPSEVEEAALEMMSAACVDKGCRNAIAANCVDYLEAVVKGEDSEKGLAAIVLAKVRYGAGEPGVAPKGIDELAGVFRGMMLKDDEESRSSSMEGLAYATLKGSVKESLIKDKEFLRRLLETLKNSSGRPTVMFGGLTVVANLTSYLPSLSEEQKKVAELKNYADSKPSAKLEPDPADKDGKVTTRCKVLLDAGIVPVLVGCSQKISPNAVAIVSAIFLSLSKNQKHRGIIAQQGGVRLLLQFYGSITNDTPQDRLIKQSSSHALARILVSTNPSHVFSSQLPTASAVRPLLSLLSISEDQKDLLPVFEALLGLTNLASTDDSTRDLISRISWGKIEETLLSSNTMVQRATMELICNLMASPSTVAKFADGSKTAGNRLHILLALADAEDLPTRRAAGGALAMLTEWDKACEALVGRERGVKIVLRLVGDEDEDVRHRGVVILRNLVFCEAGKWKGKVANEGAVEILKEALRGTRNPGILEVGVECLKMLVEG